MFCISPLEPVETFHNTRRKKPLKIPLITQQIRAGSWKCCRNVWLTCCMRLLHKHSTRGANFSGISRWPNSRNCCFPTKSLNGCCCNINIYLNIMIHSDFGFHISHCSVKTRKMPEQGHSFICAGYVERSAFYWGQMRRTRHDSRRSMSQLTELL